MGSFIFRWPHKAGEVFVTGTFDDWGKTVKLDKNGDVFEKEVYFADTKEKVQYKFVVDTEWVTDSNARQESDGHNNINNVLLPEDFKPDTTFQSITGGNTAAAFMAGVTPQSTTANLAAAVPKEKDSSVPGGFPETPATEVNELSVNPIPASAGIGNPIKLNPGDPVPDPSTLHNNTVGSTVRTDKAGYEADASASAVPGGQSANKDTALEVPSVPAGGLIPESSLPLNPPATSEPGVTIQSAHPTSTTAALAGQVPLEPKRNGVPASDVPDVVKQSISQAHDSPEAAANAEAVEEKAAVEKELQDKVEITDGPATAPSSQVPGVVKDSLEEAHKDPEAAANDAAVEEKKEVEQELQQKVATTNESGEPAPTATAATTTAAPAAALTKPVDSTSVSPRTTTPVAGAQSQTQPTVTTGVSSGPTANSSEPVGSTAQDNSKEKKKKHRASGFFQRLKEKLK
ncbi:hypothetical protein BGW36DRAFT_396897 [Talaromyces proteolyticus]|uniref:AMP-activated protein kinase glycogen-binding domain-containing protein n=1 Tax=Talaromyces proteolyticus TaxID=1131652 RepID=A0AAD4PVS6_9EURO|nr:uncharacterized protein BGW36DRAFT_396897 [Talaromyces proteolyticus]KAH8697080.1 hypothetical protein BGW36DRAFT_396897 [Talaromyces proteolyticus]